MSDAFQYTCALWWKCKIWEIRRQF